jgi:hypothetical protein
MCAAICLVLLVFIDFMRLLFFSTIVFVLRSYQCFAMPVLFILCQISTFLSKFCCIFSETVLKLDSLVGDIEDTVSSIMNKNLRKNSSSQNSEVSTISLFKTK